MFSYKMHDVIYTFIRHEDRLEYNIKIQINRQTDRQTNTTTDTKTSQQCTQYKRKKNHIILVLKCSYTADVNSLKFMPITDTPYEQHN